MAETFPPIAEAFGYACEKILRHFGDGPYDELKTIAAANGQGFGIRANATKAKHDIDGVPYGHIEITFNGLPFGMISPFDGFFVGTGEPGETEKAFITWCREDE